MTRFFSFGPTVSKLYRLRWSFSIVLVLAFDFCTWMAFRDGGGGSIFRHQDKVLHALAFFTLFTLGHLSLHFDFFPKRNPGWFLNLINGLVWLSYGLFIELIQRFLSYRGASWADVVADLVGILAGALFVNFFQLHPRRK